MELSFGVGGVDTPPMEDDSPAAPAASSKRRKGEAEKVEKVDVKKKVKEELTEKVDVKKKTKDGLTEKVDVKKKRNQEPAEKVDVKKRKEEPAEKVDVKKRKAEPAEKVDVKKRKEEPAEKVDPMKKKNEEPREKVDEKRRKNDDEMVEKVAGKRRRKDDGLAEKEKKDDSKLPERLDPNQEVMVGMMRLKPKAMPKKDVKNEEGVRRKEVEDVRREKVEKAVKSDEEIAAEKLADEVKAAVVENIRMGQEEGNTKLAIIHEIAKEWAKRNQEVEKKKDFERQVSRLLENWLEMKENLKMSTEDHPEGIWIKVPLPRIPSSSAKKENRWWWVVVWLVGVGGGLVELGVGFGPERLHERRCRMVLGIQRGRRCVGVEVVWRRVGWRWAGGQEVKGSEGRTTTKDAQPACSAAAEGSWKTYLPKADACTKWRRKQ